MFDKSTNYGIIILTLMKSLLIINILFLTLSALPADIALGEDDAGEYGEELILSTYRTVEERREAQSIQDIKKRPETEQIEIAKKPTAEDIKSDTHTKKEILPAIQTEEVHVLKKADIDRIGSQSSYEEFAGLRFAKYFTVGQRVEIFQQARSIDAYILDAKHIRILGQNGRVRGWDTPAHFRSQITPLFTRAYGTQITMDNPDDPSGQVAQIRYTIDYRDTYREFYPKWPHLLWFHWMQNEIMLIHGTQIPGINWYSSINLGYRYSTIVEKNTDVTPTNSGYENRHTYIVNLALAPSPQLEWFGQFEYFKSNRPRSTFPFSPDHVFYRTELRMKSADLKTSVIPSFSYSIDYFYPFKNTFEKYEMAVRVGRDFTEKLSATSQLEYVLSLRDEPDNTAPAYAGPNPFKDSAAYIGTENRISYNVWDKFYLQSGLDFAVGTNMSDFDNWGTLLGLEYFKPGILRANFTWNTNTYYNIDDFLSTIGFKVFLFI
ncbi:MAG: hypothetical protein ABID09_02700 [Candidatus Omnitrophota bacterium]